MSRCAHKGNLHVLATGAGNVQQWQRRFYVLHDVTQTTTARLDCYQDEATFKGKQPPQMTYSINDISTIKNNTKPGHTAEHKFTFEIVYSSQNKEILFSAQSSEDMTQWTTALKASKWEQDQANRACGTRDDQENVSLQNTLYESLERIPELTYSVEVDETEASRRCKLPKNKMYQLYICLDHLSLVDPETSTTINEWPYKFIRRYGRSTSQFSFEAGRRCNGGEGLFNFRTAMADKLFSDVRNRTMAMRENQHDGDSGEIIVENHRKQSPVPLAIPRHAANAKPANAKPVALSHVPPKSAPVAAPRTPTSSKPVLTKTESGNVMEKVKTFQDNAGGIPIAVQKLPLTGKLSAGKEKGDARKKSPAQFVPSKNDQEKRMKDISMLHKEMSAKSTKHHLKTAKDSVSSRVPDVFQHPKKTDTSPAAKLPDHNDGSRGVPTQLRSRGLPSLPKATPEADTVEYDIAYSPPNDSEYSETYAEIPQCSVAVNTPSDSSDSYMYAAVGPAARADIKMSSVVADMSRNRCPVPDAAVTTDGSGDTYDYLDFAGVANALAKDIDQTSGNIYGHLSMAETEDENGYADPGSLKETSAHKNGKK